MKTSEYLWSLAGAKEKRALPILSFPATQRMGVHVRELVESASLQAEAMATVARETPTAACVSLMDLSVEAQAFGATACFSDNEVPTITGKCVETQEDAEALRVPEVGAGRTGLCVEAIRLAKQLVTDRPVLAGAIGPYSLAGRLCDVTEIMYLCYDEPETVHLVLEKATTFITNYCLAFRAAGADGVVIAEPLAGVLSPEMSEEFSCRYVKRIVDAVQTDSFAVIYHNCGNTVPGMLQQLHAIGAAAYHFGNSVDMRDILDRAPKDMLCMGNIDPAGTIRNGNPEQIRKETLELMERCCKYPNFVIASGCDIPPMSPLENIQAFFDAVQEYYLEKR